MPDNQYRCYFTDDDDRISAVELIACEDDAGAVLKAEHLLASSQYRTAELWQRARLVGKWSNTDRFVKSQEAGSANIAPPVSHATVAGK